MIAIRKAVLEDASAIATVHVAAWKETYRGIVSDEVLNNLSIQRRTEQWVNTLSDVTHAYHRAFVAEVDNQVVGFASYGCPQVKDVNFDGELFAIYILKAAHKMGIGRLLVQSVVNGLRDMGSHSMMVWVLKDNPARGFYERLGGEYLYERSIEIGSDTLMEVAYGWRTLDEFSG
ncbi:MAG: GNAT family N-acetyltransferase [Flavobacteriales bacterium]|nr:GNAT family N-acetyltransferase [Flavobacteriales bacterium]